MSFVCCFFSPKTYRPLLPESSLSRSVLHNYTARDESSGKYDLEIYPTFTEHKTLYGKNFSLSFCLSQNIVAALMEVGVRRTVCVTVLSFRHWETAARSVSWSRIFTHSYHPLMSAHVRLCLENNMPFLTDSDFMTATMRLFRTLIT